MTEKEAIRLERAAAKTRQAVSRMTPPQKELIRQAMSLLGKRKSPAKTKAARANARKPRKKKRKSS